MHLNGFVCLLTVYLHHLKMDKCFQYISNKQLISTLGQTHLLREPLLSRIPLLKSQVTWESYRKTELKLIKFHTWQLVKLRLLHPTLAPKPTAGEACRLWEQRHMTAWTRVQRCLSNTENYPVFHFILQGEKQPGKSTRGKKGEKRWSYVSKHSTNLCLNFKVIKSLQQPETLDLKVKTLSASQPVSPDAK